MYKLVGLTSVFILQVGFAKRDDSSFERQSPNLPGAPAAKATIQNLVSSGGKTLLRSCRACFHVRVVDVEQPVEAHVHAQLDVDQVGVALLQPLVQAGEAGHQLGDVQQLLVLLQGVLLEHLARRLHAQEVH